MKTLPKIVTANNILTISLFVTMLGFAISVERADSRPHLQISTILIEPYMMVYQVLPNESGPGRYYGFLADLITRLSEMVGFTYTYHLVPDGNFGYKQPDGSWDGMIGELEHGVLDMAAAPLFPTEHRSKVVDFTQNFLTVEATIVLRKPPFGTENTLTSVDNLINQSEIQYGTLDNGIIIRAFRRSNETKHRIMWRNIQRFSPNAFTKTNEEGISRVRKEKYAFILPHPIGEYVSMQYPCDIITVDKFLFKKGYALAFRKGSPLLDKMNSALSLLKKEGYLDRLYHKWWFEENECRGIQSNKMYSINNGGGSRVWRQIVIISYLMLCNYLCII